MIEIYTQNINEVWFGVACTQQQIIASSFGASQQIILNNILRNTPFNVPFQVFHAPSLFAKNVLGSLLNIYDGQNVDASFHLSLAHLPIYTQKVLKATAEIPLGYVTSYGSLAKAVGGGPRAVGNIMAANPFAPIIPCHRVVKSDLTIGGYGGGLKVKLELLNRERRGFSTPKEIEVNGGRLQVFPVEYVLKDFV
ncbi:MAG: methylated-DNA--[protein]-cysteine S-methyltransferase [Candidatus Bathyarchaeia archaeon]|jgi:O-6-methylguanine DNA methyltransferase